MQTKQLKKWLALVSSILISYWALLSVSWLFILIIDAIISFNVKTVWLKHAMHDAVYLLPLVLVLYKIYSTVSEPLAKTIPENLGANDATIYTIDTNKPHENDKDELIRQAFLKAVENTNMKEAKIDLYYSNDSEVNAFAISNKTENAIIIFDGLVEAATPMELQAVIGHELGHIKNKDSFHKIIAFAVSYYVPHLQYISDKLITTIHNIGVNFRNSAFSIITSVLILICRVQFIFVRIGLWFNKFILAYAFKQSEYLADHHGALASSKASMLDFLVKLDAIEASNNHRPSVLYLLLAEHPKTADRIQHIENIQ